MNKYQGIYALLKPLTILLKNSALIAVLSFLLTITLANELGPANFGKYSEALIYAALFSILINFGTDQSATKDYSVHRSVAKTISAFTLIRAIMFSLSIIIAYLLLSDDHMLLFCVVMLTLANFNLSFCYEIQRRNERYSYVYLIERIVYIFGAFTLIYLELLRLGWLFGLYGIVSLISLGYQVFDRNALSSTKIKGQLSRVLVLASKNLPLVIIAFSVFAFGGLSRIEMESQLGKEALGIYSAGWQLITIASMFQAQVVRVWRLDLTTAIHDKDVTRFKSSVKNYFILGVAPMCFVAIMLAFWSKWIIGILFTQEYASLESVLPVFGFYFIVISIMGLVDICWVAVGKNLMFMLINVGFSSCLLGTLWSFSDGYGMIDFALTTVTMHFCLVLVLIIAWWMNFYKQLSV